MNNCYINENNTTNRIIKYNDTENEQYINKTIQENEIIIKKKKNKKVEEGKENDKIKEINDNEDDEKEKLIITLNDINKKLNDENNKNLKLEQIYEKYNKKDEHKLIIKEKNSNFKNYFFFFFVVILFVIINLIGIFTLRGIMNSLYEIFIISIKYFLYKKSDLEKYELTDFVSRYKSPYNFYEQYFNDISKNEIDFDLMMFWDFVGSLIYEYCNYTFTSILFFVLNSILIIFIGSFDFLDINEKNHKYSFFQILYISTIYFFLWITVGCSALLSQQIYIDSFQIFKKRENKKEIEKKIKSKEEEENKSKKNIEIKNEELSEIKINSIQNNTQLNNIQNKNNNNDQIEKKEKQINEEKKGKNSTENFYMICIIIFSSFLINYIINRKITKYRKKYISKELENNLNIEEAYVNIYLKDKKTFLLYVFIPYVSEIIISLIIYLIFYYCIFDKNRKEQKKIENNEENKENKNKKNDDNLTIKKVSFKKICGYTIFDQTITVIEEEKIKKKNCCSNYCECLLLILISIKECLKNTFCFICLTISSNENGKKCNYNYCNCNCCNITSCCCCETVSFEQKERGFCICYQEKTKLKWFKDYISSEMQKLLAQYVLIIAFFQVLIIGFEIMYDEENENNQKNLAIPMLISFLIYIFTPLVVLLIFYILKDPLNKYLTNKGIQCVNIFNILSFTIVLSIFLIFIPINAGFSFIYSIKYLINNKKTYNTYHILWNKYSIYILNYICQVHDDEIEMLSNSTLVSVYLYILELIISLIKKIFPLKFLIIIQLIFSSVIVLFIGLLLLLILFNIVLDIIICCKKHCCNK